MLWQSIRRVVCLTVNVRAPDALGRLQQEMRAGAISDEMWALYMDRVLQPRDPRLQEHPFNTQVHFIGHRHRSRVMRSLQNAMTESKRLQVPLYIVQARDDAVHADDESKLTESVRAELLRRVNPDQTKKCQAFYHFIKVCACF